ncbi:probable short-chain dehydrogenase/reductase SDR [Crocosphaera subtropica ATCC 51142]|uniref:Probable short-chain dehydrogenase/reductase SDR n=1 Tax=Crocosphaera subtropica (strain ATCC 51142 / BH68) TaxID=43989 RepID=B1WPW7_CROS5|nr:SDR family oxidoreductase [Crocosphaera subtropica]ACB53282.1 probable short-chain dehydrogenase/reductase SDR [Crocosphaera subtropica ATCC 51142]
MSSSSSQLNAIITGASSGIGKATSLAFAQAGINVALVSRSLDALETVAQACTQKGVKAKPYVMDLSELTKIPATIQDIVADFGNIDIIVNNAGMGYTNLLRETSLADWQQVINLNLTSVFQCVQGVLPQMRERKKGTIINVASIAANQVFPEWGAYSVSKAALLSFSKVLAAEERSYGIRVMTVSPGAVNTSIWDTDTVQADFDRSAMLTPDLVAQTILQAALLPAEAVIEELTILPSAGTL